MNPLRLLLCLLAAATAAHASPVGWSWSGAITENSAVITARLASADPVRLRILETDTTAASALAEPFDAGTLRRFAVSGLSPDTAYRYVFIDAAGTPLDSAPRTFRTFPAAGTPASFRFAVSSCAKGLDSPAFTAAARQGARFFLHTGDFHYHDIAENRVEPFRRAYDSHLSAPNLRALLASVPLLYQWDDHDYGPNDSNKNSPSRAASLRNYRQLVPHYPLASDDGPTDQAFTVGRVRFILSDLRSERDPASRRMMSPAQDAWLRAELLAARDSGHALIFWVSSVPWNGAPSDADRWQGYAAHRAEIADFIKTHGLAGRVAILSGDAHMTAIDDGANTDFAPGGGAPIPVFQAGPLANRGSYKGGPYSHGARHRSEPGEHLHQFGLVDIADDGTALRVTWSARDGADALGDRVLLSDHDATTRIEHTFTAPPPEPNLSLNK